MLRIYDHGGCVPNILIFALVAVVVGFRLYTVLGRRTGHEQKSVPVLEEITPAPAALVNTAVAAATPKDAQVFDAQVASGLKNIASADGGFDPVRFIEGAKSAYKMVLEAFWRGDNEELTKLVSEDVRESLAEAIGTRSELGHVLDNRLVAIEKATIVKAWLENKIANITVQFIADIAAVTRNADGKVVAGSLTDAVPTTDVWTFSRATRATSAEWTLTDTAESA